MKKKIEIESYWNPKRISNEWQWNVYSLDSNQILKVIENLWKHTCNIYWQNIIIIFSCLHTHSTKYYWLKSIVRIFKKQIIKIYWDIKINDTRNTSNYDQKTNNAHEKMIPKKFKVKYARKLRDYWN